MEYVLLIAGLVLLFWGGDVMVDGSVNIARRLHISKLLIGLTLVGFGTSTPELITSLQATLKGSSGISIGNVVGSNIANILLVLGAAALFHPVKIPVISFRRDSFFLVLSTVFLMGIALYVPVINWLCGAFLVAVLVFYIVYSYIHEKKFAASETDEDEDEKGASLWLSLAKAVAGIILTVIGATLLVDNAIIIAREFNISELIIGLTLVAVGTSLPELATSVVASIKKQNQIAFGNVIGSNIYNSLFILGFTALFVPVVVPQEGSRDSLYVMAAATLLLMFVSIVFKKISRGMGLVFLLLYTLYVIFLMK